MPAHLYHIMFELIKNSMRATIERHGDHTVYLPPIKSKCQIIRFLFTFNSPIIRCCLFTKICLLFLLQYVQSKATKMSPYELVTKEVESLVEKLICYLSTFIPPHLPRNYYPHVTCPEILVWARPLLLLVTAMDFPFHGTIFKIYFDFTKKIYNYFFSHRLYARYFNGDLTLSSIEGYGTEVFVYLQALESEAKVCFVYLYSAFYFF